MDMERANDGQGQSYPRTRRGDSADSEAHLARKSFEGPRRPADEVHAVGPIVVMAHKLICMDLDEDCAGVCDKGNCWRHAPGRGYCPFLVWEGVEGK